ncbi:MAG: glycosyltransferase, partial [Pseudomonadota bacterium]
MRWFYSQCEQVYIPSQSMADVLSAEGIVEPSRQKTWSRGVELDRFQPDRRDMDWRRSQGFEDTDVVVSFVGRLVREKGLNRFASMIRSLNDAGHNVKPMIVGNGPERSPMSEKLPNAVFTGHLSGADLARAYASSDIYFNPSLTETFGNVTLEAMASGVATVCMNSTGASSIITSGDNGLLLDPDDNALWLNDFSKLATDDAYRTRLAKAGAKEALKYSWDNVNSVLLDHFLTLTGRADAGKIRV